MKAKVCAVSFLNTVPLVWGFLHGGQQGAVDLDFAVPSLCAERVRSGEADLGIIPVVEMRRQGLDYLRGTGIACQGAVRTILLVARTPFSRIRTLAADTSSRTSVVLSQIVLERKYGVRPVVAPHAPDLDRMLEVADAALIIGDPALHLDPCTLPHPCLDLGQEWLELTGLPMVFALWSGAPQWIRPGMERLFRDSLEFGESHLDDIVAREADARGIGHELARRYLTHYIHFHLDEPYYRGMERFLQLAEPYL